MSLAVSSGASSPRCEMEILFAGSVDSSDKTPASAQATLRCDDVFSPTSAGALVPTETAYEASMVFSPLHSNATMMMDIFGGLSSPAALIGAEHCVYPALASDDNACFAEHWQAEQAEAMGPMLAQFMPFTAQLGTQGNHAWHQYGGDCWGMSTEASHFPPGHWHQPIVCAEITQQPTEWINLQDTN